jgi:hypothetical protein
VPGNAAKLGIARIRQDETGSGIDDEPARSFHETRGRGQDAESRAVLRMDHTGKAAHDQKGKEYRAHVHGGAPITRAIPST